MSEQEVIEMIREDIKRVYYAGFRHGFTAALTGAVIYYFFI